MAKKKDSGANGDTHIVLEDVFQPTIFIPEIKINNNDERQASSSGCGNIASIAAIFFFLVTVLTVPVLYMIYLPTDNYFHCLIYCAIPYQKADITNILEPRFHMRHIILFDWQKYLTPEHSQPFLNLLRTDFFRQNMELYESKHISYAKANVLYFKGKSSARFVYDFSSNVSGIIEEKSKRCYLMKLKPIPIVRPKNFMKSLQTNTIGYDSLSSNYRAYEMYIYTQNFDQNDLMSISKPIGVECNGKELYFLAHCNNNVKTTHFNRKSINGKFAVFMGDAIIEYNLVNYGDLQKITEEKELEKNDREEL